MHYINSFRLDDRTLQIVIGEPDGSDDYTQVKITGSQIFMLGRGCAQLEETHPTVDTRADHGVRAMYPVHTGGGIFVDVVELQSGVALHFSDDCLGVFPRISTMWQDAGDDSDEIVYFDYPGI